MIAAGNVHEDARAETGETFAQRFGSGKIGMMGTGNFNITLAREQNPDMDFGVTLLPGVESGPRLVRRRRHRDRPKGRRASTTPSTS